MNKKWWFSIAALFALAVALVIAIPMLLPPTPGVTYANYSRLEKGMTRRQVEDLLGKPNGQALPWIAFEGSGRDENSHWHHEDDTLSIRFDENDCVVDTMWNGQSDDRNGLEKLRDRLPWLAKQPPRMLSIKVNL